MELQLVRSVFTPTATLGKININGEFYAYTLEDVYRGLNGDCSKKVQNETSIDCGRYEVILNFSDRFQKYLPQLLNVPCFEGIRIHGGNTDADTEGCILIGAESNMTDKIWNCASSVVGLVSRMKAVEKSEKIFIEITNDASVA